MRREALSLKRSRLLWMLAASAVLVPELSVGLPQDRPQLPRPLGYVSDHAGVLEAEWKARIRSVCQDLERKTGVEMVVVTVPFTKPYATARDYASALYERWGIGSAQQDHGVLVLAVAEGRQATVTVGKSLLGVITPPIIEKVGGTYLEPAFRAGRHGEGLYRATVALAAVVQH